MHNSGSVPWNHVQAISGNKSILLVWTWKNSSCAFSQNSRANVKHRNTLLTCCVPFVFNIFLLRMDMPESRTSVSEQTHLMYLSSAVHSHVFQRMCSCFWMEENGTRTDLIVGGRWCGQGWLILLSNVVVTEWAKDLEHGWYEIDGGQREEESFSH